MSHKELPKEDRQALLRALSLLSKFRELDTDMQMPQAVTLLYIALNDGISLADLTERTGQASSSTSRNVASLSTLQRKGKDGHGLVINEEDPNNRRMKRHTLTPKGKAFIRQLIEIAG